MSTIVLLGLFVRCTKDDFQFGASVAMHMLAASVVSFLWSLFLDVAIPRLAVWCVLGAIAAAICAIGRRRFPLGHRWNEAIDLFGLVAIVIALELVVALLL